MTCVSPEGAHLARLHRALERSTARRLAAHRRVRARAHAARRSACSSGIRAARARRSSAGRRRTIRCASGNWPMLAPSPLPYLEGISQAPREMTRADMDHVRARVRAQRRSCGARGRLRHARAAHGARLSARELPLAAHEPAHGRLRRLAREPRCASRSKCSPPCARRGRRTSRCRCASRRATGREGGLPEDDCSRSRARSRPPGADLIDVSSGQTVPWQKPVYGRMYQTPFSDLVRNDVGIADHRGRQHLRAGPRELDHRRRAARISARSRARISRIPRWTLRAAARAGLSADSGGRAVSVRQEPARAQSAARGADRRARYERE